MKQYILNKTLIKFAALSAIFTLSALNGIAQNNCSDALPISSIPFSSGAQTTCGTGNDFNAGSYGTNSSYGGGEDYVYSINITAAPVTYIFNLGGSATWKILDVNSSCAPTSATSLGGVVTSSSSSGVTHITFPSTGTYYIFIDTWPSPTCGEFTLDITIPPPPPANDDITGATALTVNPDYLCGTTTAATTESATPSLPAPSCNPAGANDDVWFSFVATNATHRITLNNVSGSSDRNMVVYESDGTTEVTGGGTCANTSTKNLTGLTPGNTYYLRVYTYTSTLATFSTFNVCVGTPPPPPANDDITGATALTVNPDFACGVVTLAHTESATASLPAPSCNPSGANDDIWFSFVATNAAHRINLSSVSGSSDRNMVVYESDGTTEVTGGGACANTSTKNLTGLTPGNTYYLRVYTYSSSTTTVSSFNVCVGTPPPPPANDLCENAIDLSDGTFYPSQSTQSANQEIAPITCASYTSSSAYDVWYSITADEDGDLTVTATTVTGDITLSAYEGICGSLTLITCSDEAVSSGDEVITIPAVAGQTYYFRVYRYSTSDGAVFDIVAEGTPLSIQLGDIAAKNNGSFNIVNWNTLKEEAGDQFIIERSADSKNFSAIGIVDANGNASTYEYIDNRPLNGISYYRIHIINTNGQNAYSHIVTAEANNENNRINAYPNPSKGLITVDLQTSTFNNAQLSITDITGRTVRTIDDINTRKIDINITEIPAGIYFIKFVNNGKTDVIKITKN